MNPNVRSDRGTIRRWGTIAVSLLGAGLLTTGPAQAADSSSVGASATSSHHLRLDMPNDTPDAGFTPGPYDSLIAAPGLVPGVGGSVIVGLQNEGPGPGVATLAVNDLINLEVACTSNEAAVDITCGSPNPGELAANVRLTVSAREHRAGTFRPLFSGTVGDLAHDTLPHLLGVIDEDDEWDVLVDYLFVETAGNEAMTDRLAWNFAFGLHGTDDLHVIPGIGVVTDTDSPVIGVVSGLKVILPNLGGTEVKGLDLEQGGGSIPTTGAPVEQVVRGAVWAILAGLSVLGLRRFTRLSKSPDGQS
jgi:hypothetical protein